MTVEGNEIQSIGETAESGKNLEVDYLEALSSWKVISKSELKGTASEVWLVTLKGKNGEEIQGIWKPESSLSILNSNLRKDWVPDWKKEVAAYLFADFLFGDDSLVPPTTVREIEGRIGSLQLFVEGETLFNIPPEKIKEVRKSEGFVGMLIFDLLTINIDRNSGNILVLAMVSEEGEEKFKVYAIDNAETFFLYFLYTRNLSKIEGYDLSQYQIALKIYERISEILGNEELRQKLISTLGKYLPFEWIDMLFYRMELFCALFTEKGKVEGEDIMKFLLGNLSHKKQQDKDENQNL